MLQKLLQEAKNIEASVELDSVFESVNLSQEVKEKFKTVFEQSVKSNAVKLAESHINKVIEDAEAKVVMMVEEKSEETTQKLYEDAEKYFTHIAAEWMTENKKAIDNEIKANLFESMLGGMKELFVEHNVEVPTESVDVVAELETELEESVQEVKNLFNKNCSLVEELKNVKREVAIKESTTNLTESQKEKVHSLIEGVEFNDSFDIKLSAIVSMMSEDLTEQSIVQAVTADENVEIIEEGVINKIEDQLNYGAKEPKVEDKTVVSNSMASYLSASSRIK